VLEMVKSGLKDITLISNDAGNDKFDGIGTLICQKRVKKLIASHAGLNPQVAVQMNAGELEVELVPQGTLAERIRCGGTGLGGVLTPTGIGTVVAEGKQIITVNGKDYLLETPLRADVAVIKAWKADEFGNLVYRRAARNFNPMMAMAADIVIAEVEEVVPVGEIDPDMVMTPGVCVDYVVKM
jgi:acetate CoA/acetoacetate CoA-transferase alpha subunit